MFSIQFTDQPLEHPYDDSSIPAAPGILVMGKKTEGLLANLALWDKKEYELHWRRELKSLIEGKSKVALITCYNDPEHSSRMEIWPAYRDGDVVRLQNHLLSYENTPPGFVPSDVSSYVEDRAVTDEDGNRLSEWVVTVQDIQEFLERSRVSS